MSKIKLYRYMPMDAAMSTLHLRMWRLGRIADFNDPFDCLFSFKHDGLSLPPEALVPFSKQFRITEFSKYGILCFSEIATQPSLWVHYADELKGVCLECEVEEEESVIKVQYSDSRAQLDITRDEYLTSPGGKRQVGMMIGQKHTSWRYEQERRFYIPVSSPEVIRRNSRNTAYSHDVYHWLPMEHLRISRVIVGPEATQSAEAKLRQIAQKSGFTGLSFDKAAIHHSEFKVSVSGE